MFFFGKPGFAANKAVSMQVRGHHVTNVNSSRLMCASCATHTSMKMKVELQDFTTTCVSLEAGFKAPHNLVFDMLSNPENHTRIFSSIKEAKHQLVEENGPSKTWSLDYKTAWKFWKVGGVCDTRCFMWTDSEKGTVTFRLREPGFLKVYEGTWTIRPAHHVEGLAADDSPTDDLRLSLDQGDLRGGIKVPRLTAGNPQLDGVTLHSSVSKPAPEPIGHDGHDLGGITTPFANLHGVEDSTAGLDAGPRHKSVVGGGKLMVASVSMQADQLQSHNLSESLKCWLGDYVGATASAAVSPLSSRLSQQLKDGELGSEIDVKPAVKVPPYTIVTVEKKMAPKMQPPYPLNLALKGNAAGQIQEMVESLIAASQEMAAADLQAGK